MRPLLHTVPLLLAVVLAVSGCHGRADVEDTVQREIEAITAMKQLSLVEYRVALEGASTVVTPVPSLTSVTCAGRLARKKPS